MKHNQALKKALNFPLTLPSRIRNYPGNQFAKRFAKSVIGGKIIVKPQNLKGRFAVFATSHLALRIIKTGAYEPETTKILERWAHLDGQVVNIGANVGFFAIEIAQTFKKCNGVYAIEPNPAAYSLLVENIALNGVGDTVKPVQICIGNSEGEVDFAVIEGKPEYSSISTIVHPAVADCPQQTIRVNVARLDHVLGDAKTSLMIIDTEGAEYLVFKGSEHIIRRDKPVLLFECVDGLLQSFGHTSAMIEELLQSFGYVVRDAHAPMQSLHHPFHGEAIAVPESMKGELRS